MRRNAPVIIQKTEDEKSKAELQKAAKAAEVKLGAAKESQVEVEGKIKAAEKTLKSITTSIEKTKVLAEKAEKKLSDLKKDHAIELAKIGATKSAVVEAQKKTDEQLLQIEADFTKKKQDLESELTSMQVKITQAEVDASAIQGKIDEYIEKIKVLSPQVISLEAKIVELNKVIEEKMATTQGLDAVELGFRTKIEEAEKRIAELQTKEVDLTSSVEEKEATLGAVDPEREALAEERAAFEKEKGEFMTVIARVQKQEQMNKEDEKKIRAKYQKLGIPFN